MEGPPRQPTNTDGNMEKDAKLAMEFELRVDASEFRIELCQNQDEKGTYYLVIRDKCAPDSPLYKLPVRYTERTEYSHASLYVSSYEKGNYISVCEMWHPPVYGSPPSRKDLILHHFEGQSLRAVVE